MTEFKNRYVLGRGQPWATDWSGGTNVRRMVGMRDKPGQLAILDWPLELDPISCGFNVPDYEFILEKVK